MKRILTTLAIAVGLCGTLATSAMAQGPFYNPNASRYGYGAANCERARPSVSRYGYPSGRYNNETRKQARTDNFLDRHDRIDDQLSAHPGLIDNPRYLEAHPALAEYLRNHPGVRAQWMSHPERFMDRQARYDRYHQ